MTNPLENPAVANQCTYLLYSLTSSNLVGGNAVPICIGEVPFQSVTFTQLLNAPGSFSGTLNFLDPNLRDLGGTGIGPGQLIQPGKTALFIDYQGTLVWGGIIQVVNYQRSTASAVPIQGKEFFSYFTQRIQAQDYTNPTAVGSQASYAQFGTAADPMNIAASVVFDAVFNPSLTHTAYGALGANGFQGGVFKAPYIDSTPGAGPFPLGIAANGVPINVYDGQPDITDTPGEYQITLSLPLTQYQTIDTIITNLSQMGYPAGFDFAIDVAYNGSGYPVLTLNLNNPRRGVTGLPNLVVITTGSTDDYSYPQDSTQQATFVQGTGSGAGQISASAFNNQPCNDGWPLLESVTSYANVSALNALAAMVTGDVQAQCWPVTTPTVTIPTFGDPAITEFKMGDDVRWIVEPPNDNSPTDDRFPYGQDSVWRIISVSHQIADQGISWSTLTLNVPPETSAAAQPPT
jgi:hypothetical protein